MMKVVSVVGTRPQFIKAAVLSRAFAESAGIKEILVHTSQHYDEALSEIFFRELDIPLPHYRLGIGSGTHASQTGRMLPAIETVLLTEQPNWVIVFGDTNTTLAGALAAAKLHIPIAHVEAGLRSFNRKMPEEINRVVTDHICEALFAPTAVASENLQREGIPSSRIHQVGDLMYDAAFFFGARAEERSNILERLSLDPGTYVLATIHRAENTDHPARLRNIVEALARISSLHPVIFPLHPRTRNAISALEPAVRTPPGLQFINPIGYLDMVMLEKQARLIATDSGGVQKEAFFYEVPCVTLRDETEWLELVDIGWNRLAPPVSVELIVDTLSMQPFKPLGGSTSLYGTGGAGQQIVRIVAGAELACSQTGQAQKHSSIGTTEACLPSAPGGHDHASGARFPASR